jgi:hypothetical protein
VIPSEESLVGSRSSPLFQQHGSGKRFQGSNSNQCKKTFEITAADVVHVSGWHRGLWGFIQRSFFSSGNKAARCFKLAGNDPILAITESSF